MSRQLKGRTANGRGALPTFFIIGAPKTGTTSFHHYLDQHPQIQMSAIKEPAFFAPSPNRENLKRSVNRRADYERLFDSAAAVRGEASTVYSEYPFRQGVPERIHALVPDAKFIYLVRDPIARTVSHYHHHVASEGERRSLREALSDLSDPRLPWLCASLYALQLELYLRVFPIERVLVVDQADLLADRRGSLRRAFAFLGVDEQFDSPEFDVEHLRSSERRTYPPALARFVGSVVRPRTRWLPARMRHSLRLTAERALLPRLRTSELDEESRARLSSFYAGEVARLRELTGERFPAWSV